jgi:hypothetical protein
MKLIRDSELHNTKKLIYMCTKSCQNDSEEKTKHLIFDPVDSKMSWIPMYIT